MLEHKTESKQNGDHKFDWLDIPGRMQFDLMALARKSKLTIQNEFTVLDWLLRDAHKFSEPWRLYQSYYADAFPQLPVRQLPLQPRAALSASDTFALACWTAVFVMHAEQDKSALLEAKSISALTCTPFMQLSFKGNFVRVTNMLFKYSCSAGQADVLFSSQSDLLRENWPLAKDHRKHDEAVEEEEANDGDDEDQRTDGEPKPVGPDRIDAEQQQQQYRTVGEALSALAPRGGFIQGGKVVKPLPGPIRRPLGLLDFKSLYPTLMQNLDPGCMIRTRSEALYLARLNYKILHQNASTVNGQNVPLFFVDGCEERIPENVKTIRFTVLTLLALRGKIKRAMGSANDPAIKRVLDAQQLAVKVMTNAIYGVMKLLYPAYSGVITWRGRNYHQRATNVCDSIYGLVTYGDTDSVVLILRKICPALRQLLGISTQDDPAGWAEHDQLQDTSNELGPLVKRNLVLRKAYIKFTQYIADEFTAQCEPGMELECEGLMLNFLISAKKTYSALLYEKPDEPKMKMQGGPPVKRDRAKVIRDCYTCMSNLICDKDQPEAALAHFAEIIGLLRRGDVVFQDLYITRELKEKTRDKQTCISANVARVYKDATGHDVANGERIVYVMTNLGATASQQGMHFMLAAQRSCADINLQFYIQELITVCTAGFGTVFGPDVFDQIASGATRLFGHVPGIDTTHKKKRPKPKTKDPPSKRASQNVAAMLLPD